MSPRFPLIIISLSFASVTFAAAPNCQPNYVVDHAACQDTGEVIKSDHIRENKVLVNSGACDIPDAMGLCREYSTQFTKDRPGARNIQPSNPQLEGVAALCKVVKQKHNVYCDFDYDNVTTKKVPAENCAVENIRETSGCFESAQVSLDAGAVKACLSKTITSESDVWIKATCLHDLDVANDSIKISLSAEDDAEVQRQLSLVTKRIARVPNADRLKQILQAQ